MAKGYFDERLGLLSFLSVVILGSITTWVVWLYVEANVPAYMVYFK